MAPDMLKNSKLYIDDGNGFKELTTATFIPKVVDEECTEIFNNYDLTLTATLVLPKYRRIGKSKFARYKNNLDRLFENLGKEI
jgi:hypothetical protein